ncbi:MAG: radical SAM protein [Candidatus Peribacteraceae bacterium]|nr:radical SAM protein [Candidatus Peribacteraceae bacterium]
MHSSTSSIPLDFFLEATTSLCPQCMECVPARMIRRGGGVVLEKVCPSHGLQTELLEEDAEYFMRRRDYDKLGTDCRRQTKIEKGCPFDCGLCPQHAQHTCIGLIEVTNACDLRCPMCYAASGDGEFLPMETIERMMDAYIDSEFEPPEILQISGGEPTLHPHILDIIDLGKKKGFKYVMLNTNGLRLAKDEEFVKQLAAFNGGFEVYLQFDGFSPDALRTLRGRDLSCEKKKAIEHLVRHRVPTTLVATIARGVNDGDIGSIVRLGLDTPCIRGVNFQPMAYFGRMPTGSSTKDRVTLTGIIRRMEEQTDGLLTMRDFVPLPCDVDRVSLTYLRKNKKGKWTALPREIDIRKFVPAIKNTFAFSLDDAMDMKALQGCGCLKGPFKFIDLLGDAALMRTVGQRAQYLNESLFRISITSFVDAYNFDLRSMQKECVHIITPDGRKIPFSAYNMIHRTIAA